MIRRYCAALPLALAIGLIAAGCGSDSSGETSTAQGVSIPAVTSPIATQGSVSTETLATTPDTTFTTKKGKTFNPQAPDSEFNDVPPEKGSPEAAFEEQCREQGTCD